MANVSDVTPEGWTEFRQGDVVRFYNGRAYKLTEWEAAGTPVIRLQNLTGSGKEYYYSNLELPAHQYCNSGDLLYMWSATFGPHIWKRQKAIYHYHIWKVVPDEINVTKHFLFQLLGYKTNEWLNQSNGMGILHITKGGMEDLRLTLPPLPEQQKIATILSSVDDVIEKTRAQIDKLKDLKTGMMQELLTKGIGHAEFKDSPVGRIPASWTVGLFEDLCVLQRGFDLPVQDRLKGDVPILGSNGIVGRHNEAKVLSPAVITGRSGSLGDVLFVLEDCWPLNTSLYIKDFKGNDEKFVFYFLQHFNLKKYGTGTGVPTLNRNDVHIVNVSFPCLVEQIKIAEALTVIDETIAKKACSIESKKSLKKALMQDLLTGKVRVKFTDKESAVV